MQYTRHISFTPSANKPGELHRIMIVVIEIGFPKNRDRLYLTNHNSWILEIKTPQIFSADYYIKYFKPLFGNFPFNDSSIIDLVTLIHPYLSQIS